MQTSSGVLMPTPKGERIIGHYSSYTVFTSGEEPQVMTAGESLETDLHPRVRTSRKFGFVPQRHVLIRHEVSLGYVLKPTLRRKQAT